MVHVFCSQAVHLQKAASFADVSVTVSYNIAVSNSLVPVERSLVPGER